MSRRNGITDNVVIFSGISILLSSTEEYLYFVENTNEMDKKRELGIDGGDIVMRTWFGCHKICFRKRILNFQFQNF
jgi:hypothetical protein